MVLQLPNNAQYVYKPENLYLGKKKMNMEIEAENLLLLRKIFNKLNIEFLLFYGTLLGAIRDNSFIKHDEDVDIALKYQYFEEFQNSLFILRDSGFELVRIDKRGFASIIRKNEYIDLYFFSRKNDLFSECCGNFIYTSLLNEVTEYSFYNSTFLIPKDYLVFFLTEYGLSWNTPIEYKHSNISIFFFVLIYYIKKIIPAYFKKIIYSRKSKKNFSKFINKIERVANNENIHNYHLLQQCKNNQIDN